MKKLVLIGSLVAMLSSVSALGQGYAIFQGGVRAIWDGYGPIGGTAFAHNSTSNSVAFLWAPTGSVPLISSIQARTATNVLRETVGPGVTNGAYSIEDAWTAILTDPLFHLGTNASNGQLARTNSNLNGSFVYSAAGTSSFGILGTNPDTQYTLYVIAWYNGGGAWLDPVTAAANDAYVGWSAVFNHTLSQAPPTGFPSAFAFQSFGTAGFVPEPSTFALAGLGAAALLIFRRRK